MDLSPGEFLPMSLALISHHVHPLSDAICTAPQEYFSHIGIPSICWDNWRVKILLLDADPINSFAVGILAKTSPFDLNPLGGHAGTGEGVGVGLLAAASATGTIRTAAITNISKRLITVPPEFTH